VESNIYAQRDVPHPPSCLTLIVHCNPFQLVFFGDTILVPEGVTSSLMLTALTVDTTGNSGLLQEPSPTRLSAKGLLGMRGDEAELNQGSP
jgi:hypothetical protein